jgi:hypothetical protein
MAILIIIIIFLIIDLINIYSSSNKSVHNITSVQKNITPEPKICVNNGVPAQFCSKAMKLGYYCPSWNAKKNEFTSNICIRLEQGLLK